MPDNQEVDILPPLQSLVQKYQKHDVAILFKIDQSNDSFSSEKPPFPNYQYFPTISEKEANVTVTLTANSNTKYSANQALESEYFIDIQYNTDKLFTGSHPEKTGFLGLLAKVERNLFGISHADLNGDLAKPLRVATVTPKSFSKLLTPKENTGSRKSPLDRLFTATWSLKSLYEKSKSFLNQVKVPQHVWNQQDNPTDYFDFWGDRKEVIWRDLACGTADATFAELTGVLQLGTFLVDLTTNSQFRGALIEAVSKVSFSRLQKAFSEELAKFANPKIQYYQAGFTATEVGLILVGIGGAKKITKLIGILADPKKAQSAKQMSAMLDGIPDKNLRKNARQAFSEIPPNTLNQLKNYPAEIQERFLKDWLENDALQKAVRENGELIHVWNKFPNHEIRKNADFLNKIAGFSDDIKDEISKLYATLGLPHQKIF